MAAKANKHRTFTVQDQLLSKLGAPDYGRLLDGLQKTVRRPSRRRRRPRRAVAA